MGSVFRYNNYQGDLSVVPDWAPGEPWDNHYGPTGFDDRDSQLEDAINSFLFQTAINWTPVVTQGVNVPITVTTSTYMQVGRKVFFDLVLVAGGAGTAANTITMTLPVQTSTVLTTNSELGTAHITDVSLATRYDAYVRWMTIGPPSTCAFASISFGADPSYLGSTVFTVGLATGDIISAHGFFDAVLTVT